jgi:PAS domain S-box-containing protein
MTRSAYVPSSASIVAEQPASADEMSLRCPLPMWDNGLDAVTPQLCDDLAAAGCPLAPAVLDRWRFESLLAHLLATFVNLPASRVDVQIELALRRIVEYLGLDQGGLAERLVDPPQLVITHSYHQPGTPPVARFVLDRDFPWYAATVYRGLVLRLGTLPDDLPPEATAERDYCLQTGLKSHVMIPLKAMGSVVGSIGFASFRAARDWPDDLVQRLRLVGEIFTHALARKRADTLIGESEGRFRLLAETTPVMVWMSGTDKRCTYVNKRWLEFTGRSIEREMGDGWSEGVHADDIERCMATYCDAFDARQSFRMEYRLRRFDGAYRWILDTGVPRFAPDGTFEGYIGSCTDVDEQKQVEAALRAREQSLGKTREGLRKLAARLLHAQEEERRRIAREMHDDWTQRLALLSFDIAKLARRIGDPEQALPLLHAMQEQLEALSEDVHAVSRQLHPAILDDLGLVEALRSECTTLARRERIAIDYRADAIPPGLAKDAALCIYRVVQEALRNLAKHAAVKEAVVSLTVAGPELCVRVEDRGAGFDSAAERSHPGLGLSSMHERVRLVGADLAITSAPGQGTTVQVRVPLRRTPP